MIGAADLATEVLAQGFIFGIVVFGMFLSCRVVRFDDLTVEGAFGTGGALCAFCITSGLPGWCPFLLCPVIGALAGMTTGLLHHRAGMSPLVSGICVTTALFSVNLRSVGAHVSLARHSTWIDGGSGTSLLFLGILALVLGWGMFRFLVSEVGMLLRAAGENPKWLRSHGRNPEAFSMAGLALANACTALAGVLFVQWTGFFSITGNVGVLIIALSSLILGERLGGATLWTLLFGALLYQAVFAFTIALGVDPSWKYLIKAVLIVSLIAGNHRTPKGSCAHA